MTAEQREGNSLEVVDATGGDVEFNISDGEVTLWVIMVRGEVQDLMTKLAAILEAND